MYEKNPDIPESFWVEVREAMLKDRKKRREMFESMPDGPEKDGWVLWENRLEEDEDKKCLILGIPIEKELNEKEDSNEK